MKVRNLFIRFSNQRAASLVECAVALPLVFVLLLGLVDFTRIIGMRFVYRHALSSATRDASISANNCMVDEKEILQNFLNRAAQFGLHSDPKQFAVSIVGVSAATPPEVTVSATVQIQCIFCSLVGMNSNQFDFVGTRSLMAEKQQIC